MVPSTVSAAGFVQPTSRTDFDADPNDDMRIGSHGIAAFLFTLTAAGQAPIALKVGTLIDGKGGVLHDTVIVVHGSRIDKLDPAAGFTYDLRDLTVLPGMVDTHVHLDWHFGPDGRYVPQDNSPTDTLGYGLENAYVMLMAGFTTVQSVGSPIDADIRGAINGEFCRDRAC